MECHTERKVLRTTVDLALLDHIVDATPTNSEETMEVEHHRLELTMTTVC